MQNSIERFAAGLNQDFEVYRCGSTLIEIHLCAKVLIIIGLITMQLTCFDSEEHWCFPHKEHLQVTERFIKFFGL